jgi:hypothetical protein
MKSIAYSVLFIVAVLLSGCESTVTNIELPATNQKLVVISFISPSDSIISAVITNTEPLYGPAKKNEDKFVRNASVTITDGITSAGLIYNPTSRAYEALAEVLNIQPQKTYTLTVSTPDGRKATAMCSVPRVRVESATITLDSLGKTYQGQTGATWYLDAQWPHVPGADYYRLAVSVKSTFISANNTTYYNEIANYGELRSSYINVQEKTANLYSFKKMPVYLYHDDLNAPGNGDKNRTTSATVHIMVTSPEYYRYHMSLEKYSEGVFSEPSQLYTNIEGGLGVFAAYTSYKKHFTF